MGPASLSRLWQKGRHGIISGDLGELPMGTIMVVGDIFHLLLGTLRVASFESNLVNPSIPKMEVLDACF